MASILELQTEIEHNLSSGSTRTLHHHLTKDLFIELFQASTLRNYEILEKRQDNDDSITFKLQVGSPIGFTLLIDLSFRKKQNTINMKFNLIHQDSLIKIFSYKNRQVFCKLLQKYNLQLVHQDLHFSLNMTSGLVAARYTKSMHLINSHSLFKEINKIIQNMTSIANSHVSFMLKEVNQKTQWEIYAKENRFLDIIQAQALKIMEIRELIALAHIQLGDSSSTHKDLKQFRSKQLINFLQTRQNMINKQQKKKHFLGSEMNLYTYFYQQKFFETRQLTIDKLQTTYVKEYDSLFYKFQPKKLSNGENLYLFNTVLVKNQTEVVANSMNCYGGNSQIKIAEMEIAYTQSENPIFQAPKNKSRGKSLLKQQANLIKRQTKLIYIPKTIAIKMPKEDKATPSGAQKIKHQKMIVQHFRTTCSPFLLKYYHSIQSKFKFRHNLLMDYIGQFNTLRQYTILHSSSLFLPSKMHIFIHLSNALKFLQQQGITHMDLSTNNIIITRDLLIKIIDFGEAYHSQECDNNPNYMPGYTLPFCPPENFNKIKKFTPKSDIFSFGMILFNLLFNSFPLQPTPQILQSFIDRTYPTHLFIAPQQCKQYGQMSIILLLLQLVTRCLDKEQTYRPIPYWLYVILNKISILIK